MTTIQTCKFGCSPLSETDHQKCQEKPGVLGAYVDMAKCWGVANHCKKRQN